MCDGLGGVGLAQQGQPRVYWHRCAPRIALSTSAVHAPASFTCAATRCNPVRTRTPRIIGSAMVPTDVGAKTQENGSEECRMYSLSVAVILISSGCKASLRSQMVSLHQFDAKPPRRPRQCTATAQGLHQISCVSMSVACVSESHVYSYRTNVHRGMCSYPMTPPADFTKLCKQFVEPSKRDRADGYALVRA
jgi:hypothetical protein